LDLSSLCFFPFHVPCPYYFLLSLPLTPFTSLLPRLFRNFCFSNHPRFSSNQFLGSDKDAIPPAVTLSPAQHFSTPLSPPPPKNPPPPNPPLQLFRRCVRSLPFPFVVFLHPFLSLRFLFVKFFCTGVFYNCETTGTYSLG